MWNTQTPSLLPFASIVPRTTTLPAAENPRRMLIIWTLFMRILLNIWPLNGIRASESLPLFTIIKRRWSSLTRQIHALFLPLCLADSITWHAKTSLFSWQMQKGNDLLLIYLFTLHLSPSQPPSSPSLYRGEFFNFLHENNAIAFLASPARRAAATDGLPSSLNVWLILGEPPRPPAGRSVWGASHIRHACNVCRSQVNGPPHPASSSLGPWGAWMNGSAATSVHSHQTRRCNWVLGWCEWAWAQSIHPPYYHPAPALHSLSLFIWERGREHINGCGSSGGVITRLNERRSFSLLAPSHITLPPSVRCLKYVPVSV